MHDEPHVTTTCAAVRHFDLLIDGARIGLIEYQLFGDVAIVLHTEIARQYGGQGYGSELARQAASFFRDRGWRVVPVCGFFARYLRTHPDQAALATDASRQVFDL